MKYSESNTYHTVAPGIWSVLRKHMALCLMKGACWRIADQEGTLDLSFY